MVGGFHMGSHKVAFMIIALTSTLCACASSVSTGSVPESGLTVEQIYSQVTADNNHDLKRDKTRVGRYRHKVNFSGYTRTAKNETESLFKPMENPMVPIYIYPHIAQIGDEQIAKPGYTTAFFLFKRNHFALNSERY